MTGNKAIKSAMESMMFTWGEPLEAKMAADVFNITKEEAYECFKELQAEYEQEGRGIVIREVNKAFQFVTRAELCAEALHTGEGKETFPVCA